MKHYYGDIIRDKLGTDCVICITTNGFIKRNREAVMGRGIALSAQQKINGLSSILGNKIINNGNITQLLYKYEDTILVSFPVKYAIMKLENESDLERVVPHMRRRYKVGHYVPGWACVADLNIIKRSYKQLLELMKNLPGKDVYLPKPGCGAGMLNWCDVKPILTPVHDRIYICDFEKHGDD